MKEKYAKTFQTVVTETLSLKFSDLGLHCDLALLGPTLEVCKDRLRILDISKNGGITGTLDVVSMCENLESLNLGHCELLTGKTRHGCWIEGERVWNQADEDGLNSGTLNPVSARIRLQRLNLRHCENLEGGYHAIGPAVSGTHSM